MRPSIDPSAYRLGMTHSSEGPIVRNELVKILSDLIALPSPYPPGTSVEICAYAARRLKKAGYKVEIATNKKGVDNVVARLKGKAKGPLLVP